MKYSKYPRLYCSDSINIGQEVSVTEDNKHYIRKVLRLKDGFFIRVFNEINGEYVGEIVSSGSDLRIRILSKERCVSERCMRYTLLMPLIKPERFEIAIDMSCQLGITDIIPIITNRTQERDLKVQRIERIISDAVRQSERLTIPKLHQTQHLTQVDYSKFGQIFFANVNENNTNMPIIKADSAAFVIGPEGGFCEEEISFLSTRPNIFSISLGENILRAETAAVALISKIME